MENIVFNEKLIHFVDLLYFNLSIDHLQRLILIELIVKLNFKSVAQLQYALVEKCKLQTW